MIIKAVINSYPNPVPFPHPSALLLSSLLLKDAQDQFDAYYKYVMQYFHQKAPYFYYPVQQSSSVCNTSVPFHTDVWDLVQQFHGKRKNIWNTGSFICKTLHELLSLKKISVSIKYEELFLLQKFNLYAFFQVFLLRL